jgi:hypothetical protein
LTGVLRGDGPLKEEDSLDLAELKTPPRFFPRVVLTFFNYGGGPVIFTEGFIRIYPLSELPAPRDFSACTKMHLRANAISAGEEWHPLAEFNYEADWTSLFGDIANERTHLFVYGCIRYRDVLSNDTYETGFCWVFIPPRTEPLDMPQRIKDMLAPYRAPDAEERVRETPTTWTMPGDFRLGPTSHNYNI